MPQTCVAPTSRAIAIARSSFACPRFSLSRSLLEISSLASSPSDAGATDPGLFELAAAKSTSTDFW